MSRTLDQVIKIIRNHGLYCVALTDKSIGLTDNKGSLYDTIVWDGKSIIDGNDTMSLYTWLGY